MPRMAYSAVGISGVSISLRWISFGCNQPISGVDFMPEGSYVIETTWEASGWVLHYEDQVGVPEGYSMIETITTVSG